jgi:hypothetical protein
MNSGLSIDTLERVVLPDLSKRVTDSGILFNFLSSHGAEAIDNDKLLREFESLTQQILKSIEPDEDSALRELIMQHGWNGLRFASSPSLPFDVQLFCQELGTLYFAAKNAAVLNADSINQELSNDNLLVQSYVPNFVIKHIQATYNGASRNAIFNDEDPPYPQMASCSNFNAACVLADISGFTKLSSAYCLKGSEGLDALHNVTDKFLGDLVKTVYKYGGDGEFKLCDVSICIYLYGEH